MSRAPTLERQVLDVLWKSGDRTVRDVLDALDRPLAYTTIATVLDRLHAKGRVLRDKQGSVWRYRAARSREDELASEVGRLVGRAESATEPLLVAFLDQVEAIDPEALDRLEALLRARREER